MHYVCSGRSCWPWFCISYAFHLLISAVRSTYWRSPPPPSLFFFSSSIARGWDEQDDRKESHTWGRLCHSPWQWLQLWWVLLMVMAYFIPLILQSGTAQSSWHYPNWECDFRLWHFCDHQLKNVCLRAFSLWVSESSGLGDNRQQSGGFTNVWTRAVFALNLVNYICHLHRVWFVPEPEQLLTYCVPWFESTRSLMLLHDSCSSFW